MDREIRNKLAVVLERSGMECAGVHRSFEDWVEIVFEPALEDANLAVIRTHPPMEDPEADPSKLGPEYSSSYWPWVDQ